MSPKLKKFIIGAVIGLVAIIVIMAGIITFSNLSTTTVYDLRIRDASTNEQILNKEVYLSSKENNSFDISLYQKSSAQTTFAIISSNTNVAKVTRSGSVYKVEYYKEGTTDIIAYNTEETSIRQKFTLSVKENVPLDFKITDEKAESENEISVYADSNEYTFDFSSKAYNEQDIVNLDCLSVLDYNQDVFEKIEIDSKNSKLIVKAKDKGSKSIQDTRELITVQSKINEDGQTTLKNFNLVVNVKGYYIQNIQLVVSLSPNDDATKFIFGDGLLNEGEVAIDKVIFTDNINSVNVRIRVVYSNGTFKDITNEVTLNPKGNILITRPIGGYCIVNNGGIINFIYAEDSVELAKSFTFYKFSEGTSDYQAHINNLYVYNSETGVYTFNYWDTRYERQDVVTNAKGEIIGFKNDSEE